MTGINLQTPIAYVNGIGPSKSEVLASELGIHRVGDLIHHFPFRYIDRSRFFQIKELRAAGADVLLKGTISGLRTVSQKRGSRLVAQFSDGTGVIELVWFKGGKWIQDKIKPKEVYVVSGKISQFQQNYTITHPDFELLKDFNQQNKLGWQPVYPTTEKLTNKGLGVRGLSKVMHNLLKVHKMSFVETLSDALMQDEQLMDKNTAIHQIHFPDNQESLARAQFRIKFEELFFMQLQWLKKKQNHQKRVKGYVFEKVGNNFETFYKNHLGFELTGAQKRVVKEIRKDTQTGAQMNRLLQGDVGSGKTVVALLTMLLACDNNFQSALMAPTEILATQHYEYIHNALAPLGLEVALLTGSTKTAARKKIHESLQNGDLKILVGTHALLEDKVKFQKLGLAIIDEQHRFGVAQRSKLWLKNELPPHILVMTATPIPRTLAMSVYGDLEVSVINELPPGRKSVKTVHRTDKNRLSVFHFIKEEIKKGRQIYIVYPLINESEALDYKDLMDGYESLARTFPLPDFRISIVHGQMKPEDKSIEMNRFVAGETHIMVATTVIEVGVNVPNASVMVIESAERFGLSQLHQLRGRVGRGSDQSYCILMSSYKLSDDAKTRLQTMVKSNDGFEIAEVDLKLRGPGNMLGTQQSGLLKFKLADISADKGILERARYYAQTLLEEDPNLENNNNKQIKNTLENIQNKIGNWALIS